VAGMVKSYDGRGAAVRTACHLRKLLTWADGWYVARGTGAAAWRYSGRSAAASSGTSPANFTGTSPDR
jgi:hypothetical protein